MSESPFDIHDVEVEETAEEIVTPSPEGIPLDEPLETPAEPQPQTAAERVRARFQRNKRDGARPTEPSGRSRARRPSPPKPREGSLARPLAEMYTGLGLMLAPIDPVCSAALINNADSCAKSLETLARENEAVRRAIIAMTQTSAWGGVIIAHLPILLMVMTHHGPEAMKERTAAAALLMNPQAMQHFQQQPQPDNEGEADAA